MRFCFFIDGLDELDGDHSDLIELLQELGKTTGVKICVSSRPWTVFEDAFNSMPSLMLQDLTYPDFQLFVEEKFRNNAGFIELDQREPEYSSILMEEIGQKASGVFLWVHLVVRSLLEGLTNGDRISDLKRRLDLLPPDLEDLFQKMLDSIDSFYLEHASHLFQIIRVALVPPTLLCVSLADEENPEFVFRAPVRPMSKVEMLFRSNNMRRRLNSRCKGFIEVAPFPEAQWSSRNSGVQMCSRKVQYLHRTVKDFLETPETMDRIIAAADPSFNPYRSLCSSFVLQLKTFHPHPLTAEVVWDLVTWCIEYAAQAEKETGLPEVQLLDELDLAMTTLFFSPTHQVLTLLKLKAQRMGLQDCQHWTSILLPGVCGSSFLHLAALCGLHKYLSVKLEAGGGDFRHPVTPLLDTVFAEYTTFKNYRKKPHCASALLPFETIQLLLDKGDDPNHVSPSRNSEECGRTPWQILLSEPRPEVRGPLSDWLKITESFIRNGASGCSIFNKPVWIALRKSFPEDMQRLEAMIGKSTVSVPKPPMEHSIASWTRRYRPFSTKVKRQDA